MTNLDTSNPETCNPDTSNPEIREEILRGLPRDLYDLAKKQAIYYGSLVGNRIAYDAKRAKSLYTNAPGSFKLALGLVAGLGIMYCAAVMPLKKQLDHQKYQTGIAEWDCEQLVRENSGLKEALETCVEEFDKKKITVPREVFNFIPE